MIGVLGGTFDPIHYGHLRPALDTLQSLGLRELRFVPLNVAVHRAQPLAPGNQRLSMVRAALEGQPGFVVDERELGRTGGSYTYDTLLSLRSELGDLVPICLLTGEDSFRDFLTWHRPDGILELAHLVVLPRPGTESGQHPDLTRWFAPHLAACRADLEETPGGRILFQRVTQLDISATKIRGLVARGLSPRYLLPDQVLAIIEREGLYLERPRSPILSSH